MDNFPIGLILPATSMGMFEAIKVCENLKAQTGKNWMLSVEDGRLIYTVDKLKDKPDEHSSKDDRTENL